MIQNQTKLQQFCQQLKDKYKKVMSKPKSPDSINPVSPDEIKPAFVAASTASNYGTYAAQISLNGTARQILANLKNAVDNGLSIRGIIQQDGPIALARGLLPRMAYQVLGVAPGLVISKKIMEGGGESATASFAATSHETLVGSFMEALSARSAFPHELNLQKTHEAALRAVIPFYVRNLLGWVVLNGDHDNLGEKVAWGALAGAASSIPDSVGNRMMMRGVGVDVGQAFMDAIKGLTLEQLLKGAPIRATAGAIGTLALSGATKEFLADQVINPLLGFRKTPSPDATDASASLVSKGKEKGPELR